MTKPTHYILPGGAEHLPFFARPGMFSGETWFWTMCKDARVGDVCLVYLCAPVSRIVGSVRVAAAPFFHVGNTMFDNPKMRDQYVAEIDRVVGFQTRDELTITGLRRLFPEWGWPRYPRGKTRVPDDVLPALLELTKRAARR